jgi:hypothetical protein
MMRIMRCGVNDEVMSNEEGSGFFSKWRMTLASASKRCVRIFIINLFNKGQTKIIHQKIRSHHTTPTNLTTSEAHVNRALS